MIPRTTDDALQRLLDDGRTRAAAIDPAHAQLWETVAAASEGGKRFRPALVTAAHDALQGTSPEAAAEVGAAVELLHTAFVIHDDVIDGDDVRRGRLNVSGTFSSSARAAGAGPEDAAGIGRAAGILAGDLALAAAIRAVATCGASPDVAHRLLDLFDAALHTTAAGELADVRLALHLDTASLGESLAMEEQKTSAYSFALPLQAGAVLAGADEHVVDRLGAAGLMLGVAFQLVDDLIGVFGDPAQTGKSATSDLRTRKQTPLLIHAASTAEWEQISDYVGRDLTEEELGEAQGLLTASGSRRFVEELAEAHLTGARSIVEELGVSTDLVPAVTACLPALIDPKEVAA
ncbi:polyprenyl synthetase family protein [Nocardioides sp. URHA0020]|uniref:polyprenyl synthetase family protein n=1 Tax=Nocardioides sp. URHA0020 TaxID=1380392 RepID=UPI000685A7C3|nr:polyprenyl synthetase family protein [Nocardioides sp. URHA0020]